MPHKKSPNMQTTNQTTTKRKGNKKRVGYVNSVFLGSAQEVYELQRHAAVSGAGTVSGLVRTWNNKAKPQYSERLTLLEEEIIKQTENGNNELPGLLTELRAGFDATLRAEHLQLALNSLVRRDFLICAQRGGKTEKARGAKTKCFFPKGHKLGSDFSVAPLGNNYEGDED